MSQSPYTGPPSNSSGGGGTTIIIVLVVLGVLMLGCVGMCALGIYGLRMGAQEAGKVLEKAVEQAGDAMMAVSLQSEATWTVQHSEEVKQKLGEPLTFGEMAVKSMNFELGTSSFEFGVSGPMNSGTVLADGKRQGDRWTISTLKVRLTDGSVIELDPSSAPPLDEPTMESPTPNPLPQESPMIDEPLE